MDKILLIYIILSAIITFIFTGIIPVLYLTTINIGIAYLVYIGNSASDDTIIDARDDFIELLRKIDKNNDIEEFDSGHINGEDDLIGHTSNLIDFIYRPLKWGIILISFILAAIYQNPTYITGYIGYITSIFGFSILTFISLTYIFRELADAESVRSGNKYQKDEVEKDPYKKFFNNYDGNNEINRVFWDFVLLNKLFDEKYNYFKIIIYKMAEEKENNDFFNTHKLGIKKGLELLDNDNSEYVDDSSDKNLNNEENKNTSKELNT